MQFKTGLLLVFALMLLVTVFAEAQQNCPNGRRGRRGRRSLLLQPTDSQGQAEIQQSASPNVLDELKLNRAA